jgi:hypothetical protein
VLIDVFGIIVAIAVLAGLCGLAAAGSRNGDRPGDARVSASLRAAAQPDETRPEIVVTVRNPSGAPVLAAVRARRALLAGGPAGPLTVSVPRWTTRRRFRPGKFGAVGVVPAAGVAELALPVSGRAGRCLLIAAVGQEGGRLRVHRLRLSPGRAADAGRDALRSSSLLP